MLAYLDDTYTADEPLAAVKAMRDGDRITSERCGVRSNESKQCVFSPGGEVALACLADQTDLRGTPNAPPKPEKGYEGGVLKTVKVLGAFLGNADECSRLLVARVERALETLPSIGQIEDTPRVKTAQQVQQSLLRFCCNTTLTYFLRAMPPSVTLDAARRHDELMADAIVGVIGAATGDERVRSMALRQARLPVKMGGMGLTSMEEIRSAAWIGTYALVWRPVTTLAPHLVAASTATDGSALPAIQLGVQLESGVDGADGPRGLPPSLRELWSAHGDLLERHRRVEADYLEYDTKVYDFTKEGNAAYRFHPPNLPPANTLLQLAEFGGKSKHLENAQRRWTSIVHHTAWLQHWRDLAPEPWREQVRFVAVSQPHAGDFLNAIPMRKEFRIPSPILRLSVQRRLGLPITAAAALGEAGRTSKGRVLDHHGDAAVNDGRAGHAGRHAAVLKKLVAVLREVWGNIVEQEPRDCVPYSTYIPDVVGKGLGKKGAHYLGDLKLIDPMSSDGNNSNTRGGKVAFGNTEPPVRAKMFGLVEREPDSTRNFNPKDGTGHVAPSQGDYDFAIAKGHDVRLLLVETYGGFGADLNRLFRAAAHAQNNTLSKSQTEDQASWSTRTWSALQGQRLSIAIQFAVAYEIINELGYGDGAATTAARGAAAEAEVNADEGTGEDDAAWAAGEGDGLGGREGA